MKKMEKKPKKLYTKVKLARRLPDPIPTVVILNKKEYLLDASTSETTLLRYEGGRTVSHAKRVEVHWKESTIAQQTIRKVVKILEVYNGGFTVDADKIAGCINVDTTSTTTGT